MGPETSFPKGTNRGHLQGTLHTPSGLINSHIVVCGQWVQAGGIWGRGGEQEGGKMGGW